MPGRVPGAPARVSGQIDQDRPEGGDRVVVALVLDRRHAGAEQLLRACSARIRRCGERRGEQKSSGLTQEKGAIRIGLPLSRPECYWSVYDEASSRLHRRLGRCSVGLRPRCPLEKLASNSPATPVGRTLYGAWPVEHAAPSIRSGPVEVLVVPVKLFPGSAARVALGVLRPLLQLLGSFTGGRSLKHRPDPSQQVPAVKRSTVGVHEVFDTVPRNRELVVGYQPRHRRSAPFTVDRWR